MPVSSAAKPHSRRSSGSAGFRLGQVAVSALFQHAVDNFNGTLEIEYRLIKFNALYLQCFQTLAHFGRGYPKLGQLAVTQAVEIQQLLDFLEREADFFATQDQETTYP